MNVTKTPIITQTPPIGNNTPKANLVKSEFDKLIWQQGYRILKEQALQCPCKSKNTNQLSTCKNCGGAGWLFVNPTETRMILHSMNLQTKYVQWSQENAGTSSVTCTSEERLGFMDKICVLDGEAIFWEVLYLKTHFPDDDDSVSGSESESDSNSSSADTQTTYYFSSLYPIKEILFLALFNGATNKLIPLIYGTDFIYEGNKITFLPTSAYLRINPLVEEQDISITIKYVYAPIYFIIDVPRENIQVNEKFGNSGIESVENMPIHAVARRAHYILDSQNYDGTRVLSNNHVFEFEDLNPASTEC